MAQLRYFVTSGFGHIVEWMIDMDLDEFSDHRRVALFRDILGILAHPDTIDIRRIGVLSLGYATMDSSSRYGAR